MEACWLWHGTPHGNRMARVGVGVDCVQFVNEILVASGVVERMPFGGYSVDAGLHIPSTKIQGVIERALFVQTVAAADAQFGDIAVFKNGTRSAHVGLVGEKVVWHALANQFVTRSQFSLWKHEIETLYRLTSIGWRINPQEAMA